VIAHRLFGAGDVAGGAGPELARVAL
jgi:hypothetical protein